MKVAITSTGDHPQAKIDRTFGRCSFIVVYDTESKSTEYIPNPNKKNIEAAGESTLKMIASKGITKIVSGEFGTKVKSLADSFKIQLILMPDHEKSIQEILNYFVNSNQNNTNTNEPFR